MKPGHKALAAFAVVTATASLFFHLQSVAFIGSNVHALVAALFLFVPPFLRKERDDGLTTRPYGLNAALVLAGLASLPLYAGLYILFHRQVCPQLSLAALCVKLPPFHLRLPPHFFRLTAAQLLVVALPEEYFFRGYMQTQLETLWPPVRRWFGMPLGKAWLCTALLFGLGHFLVTFDPLMLSRAIPGLVFGYMFARTRSIVPGLIFHAGCNLLMEILAVSFPK